MRLTSLLSARTAEDRLDPEEASERPAGVRDRLVKEVRTGRPALAAGLLWIVRGVRAADGGGRRIALGSLALVVGLLQRQSRAEISTLPESDLTETVRDVGPDIQRGDDATGMADVELGEAEAEEPPEDMQSDMAASEELTETDESAVETGDESTEAEAETDAGSELTDETLAGDEHETDVGTAGEDETGIDLGSEPDAGGEAEAEADEGMTVETDDEEDERMEVETDGEADDAGGDAGGTSDGDEGKQP